jgi:hypothetical protein
MKKKQYTVVVGNVGTMDYTSKKLAMDRYTTYITNSKRNETRAAGESVTLLQDGEPIMEHVGINDLEED